VHDFQVLSWLAVAFSPGGDGSGLPKPNLGLLRFGPYCARLSKIIEVVDIDSRWADGRYGFDVPSRGVAAMKLKISPALVGVLN